MGDTSVYDGGCLLFESIEIFVVFKKHRQVGDSEEKLRFVRYLLHCQQVTMDKADWELLQTRFCQNAADATDTEWDSSPHFFNDNKSNFR